MKTIQCAHPPPQKSLCGDMPAMSPKSHSGDEENERIGLSS